MNRIFPPMNDRPEKWMPAVVLGYWLFAFWFIPFWMPLVADGYWDDLQFVSWLEFVYHAINAFVVVAMLKSYLVDSFLNVQLDLKKFFVTVGIAVALMLTLALALYFFPTSMAQHLFPIPLAVDVYPINEMSVALVPSLMAEQLPLFGTLCQTLFAPIAVVGLFYTVGFAPLCCRKTWLGYLVVPLVILIPSAFDVLWRGETAFVVTVYLLQLPIHWIACWSYQKTDTVWAPIAALSIFNLVTSLLSMFFL